MANKSSIEWTDVTWNPVRGCTKISPGCKNCYASAFAERFRGVPGHPYERGFDIRTVPDKLTEPFMWPKPSTVFVNSMSDLFHPNIPEDFLEAVVQVMAAAPWHTFQVLTKRSERLSSLLCGRLAFAAKCSHIWWGVSVEDMKYGVPRIEHLRRSCAKVKFLSVEPLLEDLGPLQLDGIDWVIVGGESGRGARPIEETWVRNVQKNCKAARVPFFFKQWGGANKKAAGRILDGRTYDSMPRIVRAPIPERSVRAKLSFDLTSRLKRDNEFVQIQAQY
jgi:protein gp37